MTQNSISLGGDLYVLTFRDEFNGSTGSFFHGHGSGGIWATSYSPHLDDTRYLKSNSEGQYYVDPDDTSLPNPFSLSGGVLSIHAHELTATQQNDADGMSYASGLMTSELSFSAQGGYIEIRAQVPDQQGFLSAFWLLPEDGDWSAEIDVFEILGHDTDTLHTNVWDMGVSDEFSVATTDLSHGFHTYAVHWTDTQITWYLDGVAVRAEANTVTEEMYLALSLAIDTAWTGAPDATTDFGDGFVIDYVRVYELEADPDRNAALNGSDPFVPADDYGNAATSDTLYGTRWSDTIAGGAGNDVIHGRHGADLLSGDDGNDTLYGQMGDDELIGGAGNDHIVGGGGSDRLEGGTGTDHLWGGTFNADNSADTFVLGSDPDKVFVHDFDPADDVIDISGLGIGWAGVAPLLQDQGWATVINFGSVTGDWGDILFLIGVDATTLSVANFDDGLGV